MPTHLEGRTFKTAKVKFEGVGRNTKYVDRIVLVI